MPLSSRKLKKNLKILLCFKRKNFEIKKKKKVVKIKIEGPNFYRIFIQYRE